MEDKITLYDVNKQLLKNERPLDPIELNIKIAEISKYLQSQDDILSYMMLLCHERRDYTVFEFGSENPNFKEFESDMRVCLLNRGIVLRIDQLEDGNWEIWMRDPATEENVVYYFFNYTQGVLYY